MGQTTEEVLFSALDQRQQWYLRRELLREHFSISFAELLIQIFDRMDVKVKSYTVTVYSKRSCNLG